MQKAAMKDGLMALFDRTPARTETPALAAQVERLGGTYWKIRTVATLERLEREARRMLQLENELGEFANRYYSSVAHAVERLAQLERSIADAATPHEVNAAMPEMAAQAGSAAARQGELKQRYRTLAKEIHPDRAMMIASTGRAASTMHALNAAYSQGDLAVLLRLEAEMLLAKFTPDAAGSTMQLECALHDVERAAETYADSYRAMLGSPLNELMLRAMSARLAGWDWIDAVVKKIERTIEEKERAVVKKHIALIGAWREEAQSAA